MKPYTSRKEVRQFIVLVKYYCNIWGRRSHTLSPFTKITSSKVKFKWAKIKQDYFKEIKWIVDRDVL